MENSETALHLGKVCLWECLWSDSGETAYAACFWLPEMMVNHVSWQPAWGDEKWQMGLGRARPSLLSVPTRLDAEPSIYRDSRATEQKKAFFHQLGWTDGLCKLCVKLRSASQWLNSAHLAVLAFKHYFFHDALANRVLILVHNSQKYFFVPAFWDLSTHPFNSLHIYPSTQPSSCLHRYLSVYTPKHIAVYTPLYLSTHLSTHLSTPYTCSAIHLSTHPSISNFPSTQLSVYPTFHLLMSIYPTFVYSPNHLAFYSLIFFSNSSIYPDTSIYMTIKSSMHISIHPIIQLFTHLSIQL